MKNDEFLMLGLMLGINSERKLLEELLKARQSGLPDTPIHICQFIFGVVDKLNNDAVNLTFYGQSSHLAWVCGLYQLSSTIEWDFVKWGNKGEMWGIYRSR